MSRLTCRFGDSKLSWHIRVVLPASEYSEQGRAHLSHPWKPNSSSPARLLEILHGCVWKRSFLARRAVSEVGISDPGLTNRVSVFNNGVMRCHLVFWSACRLDYAAGWVPLAVGLHIHSPEARIKCRCSCSSSDRQRVMRAENVFWLCICALHSCKHVYIPLYLVWSLDCESSIDIGHVRLPFGNSESHGLVKFMLTGI